MLKKLVVSALTIIGLAAIVYGVWPYIPITTEYRTAKAEEALSAEKGESDIDAPQEKAATKPTEEVVKTEPAKKDKVETDESVKAVTTQYVVEDATIDFAKLTTKDTAPEVDELAYKDVATEEELHEFVEFIKEQPDADAGLVEAFYETYGDKLHNWFKTPDGEYVHLLYDTSLMSTDEARPKASVELGLNKKQIDDAVSFPFNLNEEQVKKILAAGQNQKVAFSDEEVEAQVWEYFDEVLGSYVLAEDGINRLSRQKIADISTVGENWSAGHEFLEKAEASRTTTFDGEGKDPYAEYRNRGANVWLTKINGEHYTNQEFQEYAICYIMMLLPRDARVQVLKAKAGDHSHLIAGDKNSMRVTTDADYDETLASLVFPFYTKTGKIALYFGINERDKRAEVLNPTISKKPVTNKRVTTKKTTTEIIPIPGTPGTPSNPTPGPGPGPNPTPTPTPTPETKNPIEDPRFQGNADVGGGPNDDPGPGTYKPDQGNSQSPTVPGSQYEQGTSPSDAGTQPSYDPGPAADNTDGGTPPAAASIEQHDSSYSQPSSSDSGSSGGGSSASAGNDNGAMSAPPADD